MKQIFVTLEFTPNPNTLKYSVNMLLSERPVSFRLSDKHVAEASPLAEILLKIEGIEAIMIGRDFVTITKSEEGDWDVVHKTASKALESHLAEGRPVLLAEAVEAGMIGAQDEVSQKIIDILEREIRPAVAQDGGDIAFDRFEDGNVFVHLKGSCSGCPSATQTLKLGIENRLRQLIPQVRSVQAI